MILTLHDPNWSKQFAVLCDVYLEALSGLVLGIEHVGSTAVPGLQAKPILDIDIVMRDYDLFPEIVQSLKRLGYTHNGDQGILHREAFKPQDSTVPFTLPRRVWMQHHLYVCPIQSAELQRHIAFRDALRLRADFRTEYEQIKLSIASRSDGDRKTYSEIKEIECRPFVERVLRMAATKI